MTSLSIETWHPTEAEEQAFRANDATLQWLVDLPLEVVQKHAGKWIAAKDREIIEVADTLDALLSNLQGSDLQSLIIDRIEIPALTVYR